jgi:hypothetical protein
MKHIVILAGPCAKREIMAEINRQIEIQQEIAVEQKRSVPTAVIAERLRTASEPTQRELIRALVSPDVWITDTEIFFSGADSILLH